METKLLYNFGKTIGFPEIIIFMFKLEGPLSVSEVINQHRKEWDHHKLKAMVGEYDCANSLSIPISVEDRADSLVWHFTPKGIYEVKSGYHLAINEQRCGNGTTASSLSQPPCELWKFIWSLNIQPKLRHFWWRVCRNKLATKENLHRRRCAASQHCPTCNGEVESIEHALFHCSWTRAVWFGCTIGRKFAESQPTSAAEWTLSLMKTCLTAKDREDLVGRMIVISWCIWKAINDWVFNGHLVAPSTTIEQAFCL